MLAINWADLANISFVIYPVIGVLALGAHREWKRTKTELMHELRPNSGQSLRDAVDRIERRLDNHIDFCENRHRDTP